MNQNKWVEFKKVLAMTLVSTTAMLGTVTTTLANQQAQTPQISKWALGTLNEGEKYGIFPIAWYTEDFRQPISTEKLELLLKGVEKKLQSLELTPNTLFKPQVVEGKKTRGEVVALLYNELAKYELPKGTKLGESEAVAYFQKRGILKGTDKDLELDKPCTVEQATILASKLIEDTYERAEAGAKGLAWKVTKGESVLYLLGSIHIGDTSMYPLQKNVKKAFKESNTLIVEANLLNLNNQEMLNEFLKEAMYSDGTTLKDHVSEETYNKALKAFDKFSLPKEQYNQFKPWSIANDLTVISSSKSGSIQEGAQAANLGVDLYLTTAAVLTGKEVVELEGLKFQGQLFNSLSAKDQEDYLVGAIDNALTPDAKDETTSADPLATWQKQWCEGDIAGFTSSYEGIMKDSESKFTKMLFGKRDKAMADKLEVLLNKEGKNTYFVVVGAGHLAQKNMVIDQLKNKGYTVEILK